MSKTTIAAQLYTLRDFLKTPADIAKTLHRVRAMGYEAVQLSALGPIDAKELDRIVRGEGLTVAATHVSLDEMRTQTQRVIDDHKLWNCNYTAIGGFFQDRFVKQDWTNFIQAYNDAARKFTGSGLAIGYHNHSHELMRFDGKTPMQMLVDGLSRDIWFEVDTYWITHGGGDPIQWINNVAGRIPCIHLKDMVIGSDRQQQMAEVGEGNLNWTGILAATKTAGVQWYIIEQDICQRDPFESLSISLKNAKGMGLR
ncbi:MAG: sugar phosphate isomerase/epimerase [Phycisphaerales bacterium]|jgi:sugar phosphate isomerase/epimerase|nr:sugar phosphate isomerase/epimerase [Phycisphaerales bacterium]